MKNLFTLIILFFHLSISAQTPIPLFPDIQVSQVKLVENNVTRLCYSPVDNAFYYLTYFGNVYKVTTAGNPDLLVASTGDHGIQTCQGMVIKDSVMYISGNNNVDSAFTTGYIMQGKLQANNTRVWTVLAETVPYATAQQFDHFLSGLGINATEDTLLVCSGSRGDHGEVRDNNGLYPNVRNLAITSVVLQIPLTAQGLIIPDDSTALDAMQLVYARGIRNTYDFAYNASGELFGVENSGDRDHEDEMNWMQKGHHYGFPWVMGGTENPQQHAWFNPAADLLINHNSGSWNQGAFTNDPAFPQKPANLICDLPCRNDGPGAAFMRDSITGNTYDASAINQAIYSFTPHRSPLGLVFDVDSALGGIYHGNGFVLSYTRGDSTLAGFSKLLSPFNDHAEDIQLLQMTKDTINQTYSFTSTRIVRNFNHPIDAVLLDTSIYVIEIGYAGTSSLWKIDFPKAVNTSVIENTSEEIKLYPNPCKDKLHLQFNSTGKNSMITVYDVQGRNLVMNEMEYSGNTSTLDVVNLAAGTYVLQIRNGDQLFRIKFVKK
jgi:Secretion system C-terminal sorting domain/Glucose / Sorbosone dehydrogenase